MIIKNVSKNNTVVLPNSKFLDPGQSISFPDSMKEQIDDFISRGLLQVIDKNQVQSEKTQTETARQRNEVIERPPSGSPDIIMSCSPNEKTGDIIIAGNETGSEESKTQGEELEKGMSDISEKSMSELIDNAGDDTFGMEDDLKDVPAAEGSEPFDDDHGVKDADREINSEFSTIINKGKEISVQEVVKKKVGESLEKLSKEISNQQDEKPKQVAELELKRLHQAKHEISISEDKDFLQKIEKYSSKNNLKKMAQARMKQLGG